MAVGLVTWPGLLPLSAMMPSENGHTFDQPEQAVAIQVSRWLIVALPPELADALDSYAASLEPGTTDSAAARRILHRVLLGPTLDHMPAASVTGNQPPTQPVAPAET